MTTGRDLSMPDAVDRVVGSVQFTRNHAVPGMLHAAVVRSLLPHARLVHLDTSAALACDGVVAVVTSADVLDDGQVELLYGDIRKDEPLLAAGKVRYVGDPVAIVVATDVATARRAADLVDIEYEELPWVVDPLEAMADAAPLVHEDYRANECGSWRLHHGDVDGTWSRCDRVYEDAYWSPPASHVPMEPHVALARWDAPRRLTVWTATQAPHSVRRALASIFRLGPDDVSVRTFNLGGGYGAKGGTKIEPLAALAARYVGAPVRLELTRAEVFQTTGKHAAHVWIKTGVAADGRILARDVHVVYNAGAYAGGSPRTCAQALVRASGPYDIPNVRIASTARYTNTVPSGAFRGAMTSQLCWAYESQMDDIAVDLGFDPAELRRKNLLRDGGPFLTGETMHGLHYDEILDDVAAYAESRRGLPPSAPHRRRGVGIALMIKSTLTPSRSEAFVKLRQDGSIELFTSSVEMGQGAHASMIAIAAEALGVPPERVSVPHPDTDRSPFDSTTSSSRTTHSMGTATRSAAENVKQQLSEFAAKLGGVESSDVAHEHGAVRAGDLALRYEELLVEAGLDEVVGEGIFQSTGGIGTLHAGAPHNVSEHWHQGGVAADVEVDVETGRVEVVGLHGAAFAGRVVHDLRVKQQLEGGMIWGLGPSLLEELLYDDGQLSNPNLSDYEIPAAPDVPMDISSTAIEEAGPADLHGVGEMTVPPVSPAIGNAVRDAIGVRVRSLPMTSERVLSELQAGRPDG